MAARTRTLERRPDRSPFWIGLPFSFLFFLWALLMIDPTGWFPDDQAPIPKRPISAIIDSGDEFAHTDIDVNSHIRSGLLWLARHQFDDGSWNPYYFQQLCVEYCGGLGDSDHDIGITALATLAFLNSGMARRKVGDTNFEDVIRRALDWLALQQDAQGCFGGREGKFLYGHSLATLAFARAYRIFGDPLYPRYIRRGVWFLEKARNPGFAWRYGIRDGQNDTSVTGWACSALLEARAAGIEIPNRAFDGISSWLNEVTDKYYEVSYRRRSGGPAWVRGLNEEFKRTEVMTAVGMTLRLEMGAPARDAAVQEGRERLKRDLPTWDAHNGACVDFYYWYFGVRALSLTVGWEDDPVWDWWSSRVRGLLAKYQTKYTSDRDRCTWGSWSPVGKWGREGGRVYSTALNLLTLSLLRH